MLSDDRDTASVGASRKSWKEVVIRIRYINIYIDITSVLLATKKTVLSSVNDVEVYGLHKLLSLSLSLSLSNLSSLSAFFLVALSYSFVTERTLDRVAIELSYKDNYTLRK